MIIINNLKVVLHLKHHRKGGPLYKEVETKPAAQSPDHVKFAIAQVLEEWEDRADYYYVIAEMERNNVKAFRTIVPRTLL